MWYNLFSWQERSKHHFQTDSLHCSGHEKLILYSCMHACFHSSTSEAFFFLPYPFSKYLLNYLIHNYWTKISRFALQPAVFYTIIASTILKNSIPTNLYISCASILYMHLLWNRNCVLITQQLHSVPWKTPIQLPNPTSTRSIPIMATLLHILL